MGFPAEPGKRAIIPKKKTGLKPVERKKRGNPLWKGIGEGQNFADPIPASS
jgi:hypothetical protein